MSEAAEGRTHRRGFASDNHAGAHPDVLAAIAAANAGHAESYGDDAHTRALADLFRRHLGSAAEAFVVFNGTAANVLSIEAVTRPFEAVICAENAHLNVDECGAPERIAAVKLLTVATEDGKLKPADIGRWDHKIGDTHHVQPRLVSISQASELGTVYTPEEVRALADAAHERELLLHIDGARIANAAAGLGLPLEVITTDAGADLLSFGGTKNGLLLGEAVVFLRPGLSQGFEFVRKQGMQLASKMRLLSAQFEALLGEGDLWLANATHANAMAQRLAKAIESIDGVQIVQPVESNAVFARLPRTVIDQIQSEWPYPHPFYVWDERTDVVRWMCAWDTEPADVDDFAAAIAAAFES